MIAAICASIVVLCFLILAEKLRKNRYIQGEVARKFVHITVGVSVAAWPFFLSTLSIQILSGAFLIVILLTRFLNLFPAIQSIYRKTWGDVLFPVGIFLAATIAYSPWIFAAAILHLSLADGMAAVVGSRFHKFGVYHVFGHKKSLAGSGVFLFISFLVTFLTVFFAEPGLGATSLLVIILLPFAAMLVENISPRGTDNIAVPLLVCLVLNGLWLMVL